MIAHAIEMLAKMMCITFKGNGNVHFIWCICNAPRHISSIFLLVVAAWMSHRQTVTWLLIQLPARLMASFYDVPSPFPVFPQFTFLAHSSYLMYATDTEPNDDHTWYNFSDDNLFIENGARKKARIFWKVGFYCVILKQLNVTITKCMHVAL